MTQQQQTSWRSLRSRNRRMQSQKRRLFVERLEDRRLLASIDFLGSALSYNATAGNTNVITISVDGTGIDYTIADTGESINAVNSIPGGCTASGVGGGTVTLDCTVVGDITSLTINADDLGDTINLVSIADPATVDGGTESDLLIGSGAGDTYNITGTNVGTGTVDGDSIIFSDVESVTGGSGGDAFDLNGGTLVGAIDGGGGINTLTLDDATNTIMVTGGNSGTATGTGGFSNINGTVTGGSMGDAFDLAGGTLAGAIDGGGGTNTLTLDDVANTITVTGGNSGTATGIGGFSNINGTITGGTSTDTFNLSAAGSLAGKIDGSGGTDGISYSTRVTSVTVNLVSGAATDVFGGAATGVAGVENATGGSNDDMLTGDGNANVLVGGGGADTIADGAGNDTLTGDGGGDTFKLTPGSADVVNDSSGSDTADFSLAVGNITIDMDSTAVQTVEGINTVDLNGVIENYIGNSGDSTVSVDALAGGVARNMVGGAGTNDSLTVDAMGQTVTDTGTQFQFGGGYGTISYSGWESITLVGAAIVVDGDGMSNTLTITATNATSGTYQLDTGPVVTFSGATSFTFNASDGNDELIIDNTGGLFQPSGGIFYHGQGVAGVDSDTLTLTAGSVTTTNFNFANINDGTIDYTGGPTPDITYTGLEPITSTINAANVTLNYSTATETITVTDAGSGSTTVSSTAGESTTFTNPTGTLTINAGDTGGDTINVNSLASNYPANIVIDGESGTDTVNVNSAVSLASGKSLTVNADTINLPNATSDISTSGAGTVMLTADKNIALSPDSSIATVAGGITLNANTAGLATGSFVGIELSGASISSTGAGTITLDGTGTEDGVLISGANSEVTSVTGNIQITGLSSLDDGVEISWGAVVSSTGTMNGATITIDGTSSSPPGNDFDAVYIAGLGTQVTSVSGDIAIVGDTTDRDGVAISDEAQVISTGMGMDAADILITGTSSGLDGVAITEAEVLATGDGNITISGTGTGGNAPEADGVYLDEGLVSSQGSGDILITGIAATDGNDGVDISFGSTIESTSMGIDAGSITIMGTSGTGMDSGTLADGVDLNNGSDVTSVDGDIEIIGIAIMNGDDGVDIDSGVVESTGTGINAATITMTGTAAAGAGDGVDLDEGGTVVSVDGDILITGVSTEEAGVDIFDQVQVISTGVGMDAANIIITGTSPGLDGVTITEAEVLATGDGNITITGTGTGGNAPSADGVYLEGALVSAQGSGDILITGVASLDGNDGVDIAFGSTVESTSSGIDAGSITIMGTSGTATDLGRSPDGVDLNNGSNVSSVNGNIEIIGNAIMNGDDGVDIDLGRVESTGTGMNAATITMTGSAAAGAGDGVDLDDGAAVVSVDGNILITGVSSAESGVDIDTPPPVGPPLTVVDATGSGIITITGTGTSDGVVILGEGTAITANTGTVLITALDLTGPGNNLRVGAGVLVQSDNSTVTLRAGDDLILEDSSTIAAPVSTITLLGDFGNADSGVGSTMSLFGTLDAAGTSGNITVEGNADSDTILVNPGVGHTADGLSLDGKGGDDTYHIWNGRLNGGASAVTVVEAPTAMPNGDLVIVEGTSASETFNVDGQTGGTVENLNTPSIEKVTYSEGVERLIVRGNDGNDTFTGSMGDAGVEPSFSTAIAIDGGAPGFGDPNGPGGTPDGPGDVMIFDPLNNVFQIIGKTIFTDGNGDFVVTNPPDSGDFKGVSFRRIESLPLMPKATTPELRFDFNGPSLVTQTGYTSVAPARLYGTGTPMMDFGWVGSSGATFDRLALSTTFSDLLRDGQFLSGPRTFRADVENGWHLVSIKMGDTFAHDQMRVKNADTGQVLLSSVGNAAGQFPAHTFVVLVTDNTLDLEISDLGGEPNWIINALEIRPGEILTFGSPDPGIITADGFTIDTFLGFEATPNQLITISASIDVTGDDIPDAPLVVTSTDMDPVLAGIQVMADVNGDFSYSIRRPAARGTGFVKMEHFTGIQTGCLAIDYEAPNIRRFDFNSAASPTQAPVATAVDPTAYIGVLATNLYRHTGGERLLNSPLINPVRGYGWTNPVGAFDRGPQSGVLSDLRRDAHFMSTTQTFATELTPGDYFVAVTLGDATAAHDNIEIRANGVLVTPVPPAVNTAAARWVQKSFDVSIGLDGLLDLEFRDTGGEPNWIVNGIEIRELPLVGTHTLTPNGTGTTITGSGATAGSLITVSTSLGSIAPSTVDASLAYAGVQVIASGTGTFSFTVTPPSASGTATLSTQEVTGAGRESTTFAYVGLGPVVQIIDDDGNGTAVTGFSGSSFTGFTGQGFQNDVKFTAGDNTGDTAMWTFSVVPGGTYRISATWTPYSNRALDAPYTISGVMGGPVTVDINQRVHPNNQAYTFVSDSGKFFADLGVGATYVTTGSTLTISLSDDVTASFAPNDYVIADAVRVERLSPLHAEAATLGEHHVGRIANPSYVLTADAARPVINQAIAAWQLSDPRAAGLLGNVELIVSDLPQRVLGLASETSRTLWLDVNAAGHGWNLAPTSSSPGMDLLTVISHELGHMLGLDDVDPTVHAGDLMSARLTAGTQRSPLGVTTQSLATLGSGRSLAYQTRLVDDLFSGLGRSGLSSSLASRTRDLFTTTERESLLDGEQDNDSSLLARDFEADLQGVAADRRLLSDLTSRQRLEREELDKLFAHADELLGNFDEKLLD